MSLTSKIHLLHITHTVGAYNAQIFSQYIYFLSSFDVVNYAISEIQKKGFFPICHSLSRHKSILKQKITGNGSKYV